MAMHKKGRESPDWQKWKWTQGFHVSNVIIKKKSNAMHEHTKKTFPETNKDVFCHRCIEWNQNKVNAYQMPPCDIEVICGFRFVIC